MKLQLSGFTYPVIFKTARRGGLVLLAALCTLPAFADRVVTTNGRTLEGLIKGENAQSIKVDVRGTVFPVAKDRIRELQRNTPEENARMLMDRANEALTNQDIAGSRAFLEQVKTLPVKDSGLLEAEAKLDKQLSELEVNGGTPEERRQRAQALFTRAQEAYDSIKIEEGNGLLLEALKRDPTFTEAHTLMIERLQLGADSQKQKGGQPNLELAANYFGDVLWPDHLQENNPIIPLLPQIFANTRDLFEQTASAVRADHYAQLLRELNEGFSTHPSWAAAASPELKTQIEKPINSLLAELVQKNLAKGDYEIALAKLKGLAAPDQSAEIAMLYTRALTGAGQYNEAEQVIAQAVPKFGDAPELLPHANALKLLAQAQQAQQSGDQQGAISTYETVYASRQKLAPEFGLAVGQQLAQLRSSEMETAAGGNQPAWKSADIAALVLKYGQDAAKRHRAAEILVGSIQRVSWQLNLVLTINGVKVNLPDDIAPAAAQLLSKKLGVPFDAQSPFILTIHADAKVPGNADEIVQKLNAGQTLTPGVPVMEIDFSLDAAQQTLESLYQASWTTQDLPKPAPAPGEEEAAPAADATPTTTTTATDAATSGTAAAKPVVSPLNINLTSIDALKAFLASGPLLNFIHPQVAFLPGHFSVPMAQDMLQAEATR